MALATTTVWEVRVGGSNDNGGGFNPARGGVDFSQQDSPFLIIDGTAVSGIGNSDGTFTITGATVSNSWLGNIGQISSGTGTVFPRLSEIVAVNTSLNRITLDSNASTGAVLLGKFGGAKKDFTTNWTGYVSFNGSGNIYIKSGIYYIGASQLINSTSGVTSSLKLIPYTNTRGDGGIVEFHATANNIDILSRSARILSCYNIVANANGYSGVNGFKDPTQYGFTCFNCKAIGCQTGFDSTQNIKCIALNCGKGFDNENSSTSSSNYMCTAKGCSDIGFLCGWNTKCLGVNNNTNFKMTQGTTMLSYSISSCTSFGGSVGFDIHAGCAAISKCVSVNASTYAFKLESSNSNTLVDCASYNGTQFSTPPYALNNFITLTADPFIDAANDNFSLNDTIGGGKSIKGIAYNFMGSASTMDYSDIGAVQSQSSGGNIIVVED